MTGCWAADEAEARKTAYAIWPNTGVKGQLTTDLPTPKHFEQAAEMLTEDEVASTLAIGPDPAVWVEQVQAFADAGFTEVYLHQVGRDQHGFFGFCERELFPALRRAGLLA